MLWQRAKYFLKQTCFRQKVFSRGIRGIITDCNDEFFKPLDFKGFHEVLAYYVLLDIAANYPSFL